MSISKKLFRIAEASDYLNISADTLRKYEKRGIIKPFRMGDRQDRVYTAEILDELFKTLTAPR